ncbi:MAG: putative metal-binding motif-containing protein [Pseudomonadota bacterium]|nr:putative metal-binding motif-containing protein [Pseudomonadota bacterium]
MLLLLLACTGAPHLVVTPEERDPPGDLDRDGFTADDCDDTRADIHPGAAPDACDGLDQDCDGDPIGAGTCAEMVNVKNASTGSWEGTQVGDGFHTYGAVPDQDGDGVDDLLFRGEGIDGSGDGLVGWMPGAMPDGAVAWTDASPRYWVGEPDHEWIVDIGVAGDFDGDGAPDLWSGSLGCSTRDGVVYLLRGPPERWPTDGPSLRDATDASWVQETPGDCFGYDTVAAGDLDGDGLADLVTTSDEAVWAIFGRTTGLVPGASAGAEVHFAGVSADSYAWPDLDGDGLAEVVLEGYDGELGLLSGANLRAADGADLADVLLPLVQPAEGGYRPVAGGDLGDADGDGYRDVVVEHGSACTVRLHGAADFATRPMASGLGVSVCYDTPLPYSEWRTSLFASVTPDVDADGVRDLLIFAALPAVAWDGSALADCLVPSSRLPTSGTVDGPEVDVCFGAGNADSAFQDAAFLTDLDGDGLPELVASNGTWGADDERNVGRALVLPGFDIPWDDASKW